MTCTLEFDLLDVGFRHWWFLLAPSVFIFIGLGMLFYGGLIRTKVFGLLFSLVAAYLMYTSYTEIIGKYQHHIDAYKAGAYSIAEGRVENLREEGVGVRMREYVTVDGQEFVMYGPAVLTIGYNKRSIDGGFLSPQHYVKVWHIKGTIIRLEVCT